MASEEDKIDKTESSDREMEPIIARRTAGDGAGPCVLSFVGGKGGVGQSMLAANIGAYMSQMGRRVLLVDARRWGQDLHTILGIPAPELSLDSMLDGEVNDIGDLVVDTPFEKLKLLCGTREAPASGTALECPYVIHSVRSLPFDFVILDMGSTPSFNLFDHAIWSDYAVITSAPEPTAIEGTYEILRGLYFRLFKTIETKLGIENTVSKAMMSSKELGIKTPRDLVSTIHFFSPDIGDRIIHEISRLRLLLLLNGVRSSSESEIGTGIRTVCRRYFNFNIEVLGAVDHDSVVPVAIRQRKLLHAVGKDAKCTEQVEKISHKLLSLGIMDKQEENKG